MWSILRNLLRYVWPARAEQTVRDLLSQPYSDTEAVRQRIRGISSNVVIFDDPGFPPAVGIPPWQAFDSPPPPPPPPSATALEQRRLTLKGACDVSGNS